MYRIAVSLIVAAVFFTECSDDKFANERSQMLQAKLKWEQAKNSTVAGYSFNSESLCFCAFEVPNKVTLTVLSDTVSAAVERDSQEKVADSLLNRYETIDRWFSIIDSCIDRNPDLMRIIYDENSGYPKDIYFDYIENVADDEFSHKNDSLQLIYRSAL